MLFVTDIEISSSILVICVIGISPLLHFYLSKGMNVEKLLLKYRDSIELAFYILVPVY